MVERIQAVQECCCLICARSCRCDACGVYRFARQVTLTSQTDEALLFCHSQIIGLSGRELKDFVREEIEKLVESRTCQGSFKINYKIGLPGKRISVCQAAFASAFNRGTTFVNDCIRELKPTEGGVEKPVRNSEPP